MTDDRPKTFLDAQIAFAESKQAVRAQGVDAGNDRGVSNEK